MLLNTAQCASKIAARRSKLAEEALIPFTHQKQVLHVFSLLGLQLANDLQGERERETSHKSCDHTGLIMCL